MAYLSSIAIVVLLSLLFAGVVDGYGRLDFPADFIFGSGTSAAQYEGASFVDGRTPSIWETFTQCGKGRSGGSSEDKSCDGYHKYKGDVKLMVDTNLDAFKISISWSRLIPNGRGPVNPKGIQFYNNVINEQISNGIQPHVMLSHLDLPQTLEDEYGGWLSRKIVKDFVQFAEVCFREFGDRVRYWTTLNEVNVAGIGGYDEGRSPPGRCSDRPRCPHGDSAKEPYIVVHNMLLAHSAAAKLYKANYKDTQQGMLGFNVYSIWHAPDTNSTKDVEAAQRANTIFMGWVMNPLVCGDYLVALKKSVGSRLPAFTKYESKQLKGSYDFIGVNHYTVQNVKDFGMEKDVEGFYADMGVKCTSFLPPGEFPVKPEGLRGTLEYLKQAYKNPPIYIHENGQRTFRSRMLNDTSRVVYLHAYIGSVLDAIRNGTNVKGYFAWTFLDCVELLDSYQSSFGMYYVDLEDKNLSRFQKLSARWYSDFLKGKSSISNRMSSQNIYYTN